MRIISGTINDVVYGRYRNSRWTDQEDIDIYPLDDYLENRAVVLRQICADGFTGDLVISEGTREEISFTLPITVANDTDDKFTVADDYTSILPAGTEFTVAGSTGNDGDYTVLLSVFGGGNTVITVEEDVTSAVGDGNITLDAMGWNFVEKFRLTPAADVPVIFDPMLPPAENFRIEAEGADNLNVAFEVR